MTAGFLGSDPTQDNGVHFPAASAELEMGAVSFFWICFSLRRSLK